MTRESRIQAIRSLYAANAIKPVDQKPKTDTLQTNCEANKAGDTAMVNIAAGTGTVTLTDLGYAHASYSPYLTPSPSYTNTINSQYSYPSYWVQSQQNPGYLSPQYFQTGNIVGLPMSGVPQYLMPGQVIHTGAFTYDPAIDAQVPIIMTSRSEFTEEEIEQAERIMAEL